MPIPNLASAAHTASAEFHPEFYQTGHCTNRHSYASHAYELQDVNETYGMDIPRQVLDHSSEDYAFLVDEAMRRCKEHDPSTTHVSVWNDQGYRCYSGCDNTTSVPSNARVAPHTYAITPHSVFSAATHARVLSATSAAHFPHTCDPTVNFIDDKRYRSIVIGENIPQHDALRRCKAEAKERDFFVQQHTNGHTVCGIFDEPITHQDTRHAHGHTYGAVCHVPK